MYLYLAGYVDTQEGGTGAVESWQLAVSGRAGELGGARDESLTFRHELLVVRAPDNITAIPLR